MIYTDKTKEQAVMIQTSSHVIKVLLSDPDIKKEDWIWTKNIF